MLIGAVDQDRHLALALVWPRSSRDDVLLGVARAIRLRGRPDTADVAVTVADQLQGNGAGRLLMSTLAQFAAARGVASFTATLLASNSACARLLTRLGPITADATAIGVRELTVALPATTMAAA